MRETLEAMRLQADIERYRQVTDGSVTDSLDNHGHDATQGPGPLYLPAVELSQRIHAQRAAAMLRPASVVVEAFRGMFMTLPKQWWADAYRATMAERPITTTTVLAAGQRAVEAAHQSIARGDQPVIDLLGHHPEAVVPVVLPTQRAPEELSKAAQVYGVYIDPSRVAA
jgi:hypothetical protein